MIHLLCPSVLIDSIKLKQLFQNFLALSRFCSFAPFPIQVLISCLQRPQPSSPFTPVEEWGKAGLLFERYCFLIVLQLSCYNVFFLSEYLLLILHFECP